MSDGYDLDLAVVTVLQTATGRPVGNGTVPSATPSGPYCVVTYMGGPRPDGDLSDINANRDIRYAVRCVGSDSREVHWLKDKVLTGMSAQEAIQDAQWATLEVDGAIVPDGDTLYSCTDTYLVRI